MHLQSGIVMETMSFDGMVYVIGDRFFYNSKYRGTFWCPCSAGLERFVSDIRSIEVVTGNFTVVNRQGFNRELSLNPGLRITFKDNAALLISMPDAVNFCLQLRQYQSNVRGRITMGNPRMPERPPSLTPNPYHMSIGFQGPMVAPAGPPSLFKNRTTTHPDPPSVRDETTEDPTITKESERAPLIA